MRIATIAKLLKVNDNTEFSYPDTEVQELIIDTRKITNAEHALFFALEGALRNGHQFIAAAYQKGIRLFVVSGNIDQNQYPEALFFWVPDVLDALQTIGAHHRASFDYPVIGITGSNGKTIVKEWLYELLAQCHPYNEQAGPVRSPKSYNSQIGIPLSTWLMQANNTIGIFEAGISKPGEMEKAETVIRPGIGIFTNIGDAHNEGFESIEEKIAEKLKLFTHTRQLIYCKDQEKLHKNVIAWLEARNADTLVPLDCFTWSVGSDADLSIRSVTTDGTLTHIEAHYRSQEICIVIPYTDKAYVENAIHCWACLLLLEIAPQHIADLMRNLQPVAMRLQLVEGINNCTIINDTYNSDYTSLKIALDFLNQQKGQQKKVLILSDILEVRQDKEEFYTKVARLIAQKGIDELIAIGPKLSAHQHLFAQYDHFEQSFYKDTRSFLDHFQPKQFNNVTILLKGARSFEFEKIESMLEAKTHKTVLEVDLSAIQNNLRVYQSLLQPGVKLMAMVKAFAYGTGSLEIANVLQYEGIDYLTVAYLDEGIALRKAGITLPVMVMSPEFGAFEQMINWKIEPEIFSMQSLEIFIKAAELMETEAYPIHIKLDTGMHRLGFNEPDIPQLIKILHQTKAISVQSIFSHLAGSDAAGFDDFTQQQAAAYRQMSSALIAELPNQPLRHICNTSAISRFPELQFDMVRMGIGMYGIDPNPAVQKRLQNVATLKTTIAQVREIKAGETVGYSRRGKLTEDSKIATVSIGYADGYFRDFGNGAGYMLVKGKPAATLGAVCMDMCMLNVTDIPEVKGGDRVTVFGADLPVTTLAEWADTIPYEIITSVSQRVKRVYTNET
ncbi:MAG: bifunctional UDP-N-acetylmuramoyl-tripeptide:D-alanyl-D-alanine ligase/alanine racemase [Sphingobacteriales bacterium]|nr:MAG: bifunctional UDP-N-acetylmuramoyl-tripeptide:D-alanyl-D-alanine ligase/alanine racemase [Sphingobacteriales bacterium]